MKAKHLFFLVFMASTMAACIKKSDFNFQHVKVDDWHSDWALPLVNSKLTLANVVGHANTGTVLTEDSTGLYTIHYSGKLYQANISDYFHVNDQHFNSPGILLSTPLSLPSYSGQVSDSYNDHITYTGSNNEQLKLVKFKGGHIAVQFNSTFQHNIYIHLSFPSLKLNGVAYNDSVQIIYPSTSQTLNIDLTNYSLDLTNGGVTNNYIPYSVQFTIQGTGNPINPTDQISAVADFTNMQFAFIQGYIGNIQIPIAIDTIPIQVFNNSLQGNLFLEDPKIKLTVANELGIHGDVSFTNLHGVTRAGTITPISGSFFASPIAIQSPTAPGQTFYNYYLINRTNSTIQNVFNPAPNKIVYAGNVDVNPLSGGVVDNFIADTSKITVYGEAQLPAWFRVVDFAVQDTLSLTLPRDTDLLESVEFKLKVVNAFPLYASVQFYFTDSNYMVLDSLVIPPHDILAEAPVNSLGVVNGSTVSESIFAMNHIRYSKMASKVKHGLIRGNMKSSASGNNVSVQIHSTDNLQIQLSARVKLFVKSFGK